MKPAGPSAALKLRQKDAPEDVVGHANKAQVRLHGKYWSIAVKKGPRKAVVATARELVGFVWGIMTGNCTDNNMSGHAERVSAALAAA